MDLSSVFGLLVFAGFPKVGCWRLCPLYDGAIKMGKPNVILSHVWSLNINKPLADFSGNVCTKLINPRHLGLQ